MSLIAIWCFLVVSFGPGLVSGNCLNGWIRFDDSCYKLFRNVDQTFPEAMFECETYDADLASIESPLEGIDVHAFAAELNLDDHTMTWIGLTDVRHEGLFVWESDHNTTVNYSNWGKDEPTAGRDDEDCVVLSGKRDFKWADVPCLSKHPYLCERSWNDMHFYTFVADAAVKGHAFLIKTCACGF